ncbi:universal stress protein [Streptomyces pluripotens]|uniref:Universal stress protein n=1 Tax=Streptomyces pluripotens TaxID=1355015 RepID=A0A221NSF6_9ACTN|nr:universal stress protein [Streptomyces pluripotens]ARP68640.1 universal stress protein [Streptomyces pluripotens]ASN22900.1 universal stress protein [Streptomyces pluripotens]
MTLPLVVGVDGSDSCLQAVDWAVDEAVRHGLPVRLLYASLWERYDGALPGTGVGRPSEQVLAEHIVASAADRAQRRNPDVKVTTDVVAEDAAAALVRAGDEASALVTGSRGRGQLKGLLLGSVGLAVAARAHCPVVVVRGDQAGVGGTHGRILLGLGDADTSTEAVRFAFREAQARDCTLDVVRAWRRPAYEAGGGLRARAGEPENADEERASALLGTLLADAIAEHPGVRTRRSALEGPAGKILVERSAAADLVIIGTHRRTSHLGLHLGRVGHSLLHHAQCPVAVVPQRP